MVLAHLKMYGSLLGKSLERRSVCCRFLLFSNRTVERDLTLFVELGSVYLPEI